MSTPKVVIVSTHPVVYHVDFYKVLSQMRDIDFSVLFFDKPGKSAKTELSVNLEGLNISDRLYDGYKNNTLKNYSLWPKRFFWRFINPGIFSSNSILRSDVVIVFGYINITLLFTTIYAYFLRKKIIFRGEGSIQRSSFIKETFKRLFLPRFFKIFDAVLFSFPQNKDYFKHYGVHDDILFFAPSSVDNTRWQIDVLKFLNYHDLSLDIKKNNSFVYLFCGLLGPRKNPYSLLNAFNAVVDYSPNSKLLIAGDGPLLKKLERWSVDNNLVDKVVFLGSISEEQLREVYALSDVLVLPSDYDPSPKVLHESFACGVPAVVSDAVGTVGSFAIDRVNSLVYPAGNVEELIAAMNLIQEDMVLFENLKKNTSSASNQWSKEHTAAGFIDAINYSLRIKN
jgi:glycosyltransferase involved in cell wall biosynthesis